MSGRNSYRGLPGWNEPQPTRTFLHSLTDSANDTVQLSHARITAHRKVLEDHKVQEFFKAVEARVGLETMTSMPWIQWRVVRSAEGKHWSLNIRVKNYVKSIPLNMDGTYSSDIVEETAAWCLLVANSIKTKAW